MVLVIALLIQCVGYWLFQILPKLFGLGVLLPRNVAYCGLFGFSGGYPADLTKIRWLMKENETRGKTSTGIHLFKNDKNLTEKLWKEPRTATAILKYSNDEINDVMRGAMVLQGHTRQATSGAGTKENAHPFEYNFGTRVIGAHNGFVPDEYVKKYTKEHKFEENFQVDSQIIFAVLSKTGDYETLASLEGGITCTFMMPDKYPGILFLYKRAARELHIARTREGIYYSSESEPLQFIGANDPLSVPDDFIMLLKDGEIYDMHEMEKPRITFYMGASRSNWSAGLDPDAVRDDFPELADKLETDRKSSRMIGYHTNRAEVHNAGLEIPFAPGSSRSSPRASETMTGFTNGDSEFDDLLAVVKEAREEAEEIAQVNEGGLPTYQSTASYELNDMDGCLVLLKLTSSPKGMDLPGWVVASKADESICGITDLHGITVFKIPKALCKGDDVTLNFYDPIISKLYFAYDIKPEAGSVLEVALQLPFPQSNKKTSTLSAEQVASDASKLSKLAGKSRSLLPPGLTTRTIILPTTSGNNSALPSEDGALQVRSEKSEISGDEKTGAYPPSGKSTEGTNSTSLSAGYIMFKATQLPVNFSKLDVMGQLLDARREKAFLDWMNILSKTSEYKYAGKWLDENTPFCAYDTNKILVDGAALKFTQTTRHVDKISSLMSYSVWLLVNFESTYRIREVHSPEYAQMAETFEHYFLPHWEDKKKQPKPGLPDWVMGGV